jgi:hypothetical protein
MWSAWLPYWSDWRIWLNTCENAEQNNITAEAQRPQRNISFNKILCVLRAFAVKI